MSVILHAKEIRCHVWYTLCLMVQSSLNNMLTLKPLTAGHDVGKERSFSERQKDCGPVLLGSPPCCPSTPGLSAGPVLCVHLPAQSLLPGVESCHSPTTDSSASLPLWLPSVKLNSSVIVLLHGQQNYGWQPGTPPSLGSCTLLPMKAGTSKKIFWEDNLSTCPITEFHTYGSSRTIFYGSLDQTAFPYVF